ncbi:hypothetical protein Cgig2_022567 [Carnegiea gigantea]|uniref:Uncharacterized protein n=1 Tax=Carnegiea gigantea TaxID=171969 RepID=A0A9Q1QJZ6_9CARY|nr:hypothetical protein Cgig2_022567 [Carnegiea gigantea]
MGNCVGITSTPPPLPLQEQTHESTQQDYDHHISNTTLTPPTNTPYIGTPDQVGTGIGTRTGTGTESSSPAGNHGVMSVTLDPRLLSLLDFFRQLYARRSDIFKKIMPVHREAFEDIFKGILDQENRKRKRLVVQRSNSFGGVESVRSRRFKVKPIEAGGATPSHSGGGAGGGGGGGGNSALQQQQEDRCSPMPLREQPHDQNATFTVTARGNTPYMGTPDPMGTGSGSSSPCSRTDPRVLSLLEFFRQLYQRKKDVFKRIVPVRREVFEDIFHKMGIMESKKKKEKNVIVKRSSSFGDPESVRLSRFKVKPIDSGGATPSVGGAGAGAGGGKGGGGGGSNKPAGSK